ncbi:programmed cell death protein 4-like [Rana temporaria]|uniref:programmed cell death protein 4-like n=1 Tax=Rana temporaria TaxID=8407 RepID=UPI001AACC958|nr:programmed cell death protein 4-like [Rana temporaria]
MFLCLIAQLGTEPGLCPVFASASRLRTCSVRLLMTPWLTSRLRFQLLIQRHGAPAQHSPVTCFLPTLSQSHLLQRPSCHSVSSTPCHHYQGCWKEGAGEALSTARSPPGFCGYRTAYAPSNVEGFANCLLGCLRHTFQEVVLQDPHDLTPGDDPTGGAEPSPPQPYTPLYRNVRDPNYDEFAQGATVYQKVVPELDEAELQKAVHPMVQEYFEHGDTGGVIALLCELNLGGKRPEVSRLAVSLSLEGKASHRELTSRLLSDLLLKVLTEEDMARAFNKLLINLPDLILDTPEAPQMLGQFIARAVADHALPLNFLDRYKGRVDCEHARAALDRAAVLLRIKRAIIWLDNVWGVGGGQRPVKHLIKEGPQMFCERGRQRTRQTVTGPLPPLWPGGQRFRGDLLVYKIK